VGAFRYTTKVSEYLSARRPIVTGEIPFAYDFDDRWLWRLPGDAPWDDRYLSALVELMTSVTPDQIRARSELIPDSLAVFDLETQRRQVVSFILDVARRGGGA
jgi:hypothetical protein